MKSKSIFTLSAVLVLSACSSGPDIPTSEEAAAAIVQKYRLQQAMALASSGSERVRVRVERSGDGRAIVMMPSAPDSATRKPEAVKSQPIPQVSDVSLSDCVASDSGVSCSAFFVLDGQLVKVERALFVHSSNGWRAYLQ